MAITVEFDTTQVKAALKRLDDTVRGEAAKQALQTGAHVIEAKAKVNLSGHGLHKTGRLINSVEVFNVTPKQALVGSRGVIYAPVHEFGTVIRPKRAKVLSWIGQDGVRRFAKMVRIPARPWLRPAAEESKAEIANVMAMVIRSFLK